MDCGLDIWVIGGDPRQEKLCGLLYEDGHDVHTYALEKSALAPGVERAAGLSQARRANCVILPLPILGGGDCLNAPMSDDAHPLEEILSALRPGQLIAGGRVTEAVRDLAASNGLTILDYLDREELAVANAVPTAEGAVQLAMEEMGTTLHMARVLVLGYGRVGRLTAHRIAALGGQVTVAARRCADLAWAEAYGHHGVRLGELESCLCGYDLVVNTIPARVLDRARLEELKEGCLVLDLASRPGGVDLEGAAELGVKCVWALSLPGKVAPVSAAAALRDTIYNMLREFG